MPRIQVSKTIPRSAPEAYQALRTQFSQQVSKEAFGQEMPEISWDDEALKGSFSNGKIEGAFSVTGDQPCTLLVEINLPLFLAPLKGLIQKTLQKQLETLA
jgi:hypothetical protein